MDQEKVGKFIKDIRKRNNLTQAQLAKKYGVTYQAVSKWENGKNMPDLSLIKQMSKDFNVNIEDILEGKTSPSIKNKNLIKLIIFIIIIIAIIILLVIQSQNQVNDFEFKTLSTSCNNFDISGSIAYNDNKSSIYISNIEYCGEKDDTTYAKIECILYESHNNTEIQIKKYVYNGEVGIKLSDFLKDLRLNVDNYSRTCKKYSQNSLYLQVNATDPNDITTSYKIPLSLEENCQN